MVNWLAQIMLKDFSADPSVRAEIIVDEHMRACGVQWTQEDECIDAEFRRWVRSLTTTPSGSTAAQRRARDRVDYAAMDAGRAQPPPSQTDVPPAPLLNGFVRAGIPAELGYIFNPALLPYKSQGGQDGLLTVCSQLGIPLPAGQRTASLLREKVYAYHFAMRSGATSPEALAAAAAITPQRMEQKPMHPPVPSNISLGGTSLDCFLFDEAPATLLLLRSMLVRDQPATSPAHRALHPDVDGTAGRTGCSAATCHDCSQRGCGPGCTLAVCVCTHRHRVLVLSKAMLRGVFLRRQPNYQACITSFVLLQTIILRHPDKVFISVCLEYMRLSMSNSNYGDSFNGEPADLNQEGSTLRSRRPARTPPTQQ